MARLSAVEQRRIKELNRSKKLEAGTIVHKPDTGKPYVITKVYKTTVHVRRVRPGGKLGGREIILSRPEGG